MNIGTIFKAAGAIAGGALLKSVVDKTADSLVNTSLNKTVDALMTAWQAGAGQNYVSKTKSIRVEPYVLLDSRVVRLPYIKDILNVGQRQFTSLYLLTVASDNKVAGVRVAKYLDRFAPDRDLTAATMGFLSTESYQLGLPFVGEAAGLERYSEYTTEAFDPSKGPRRESEPQDNPIGGQRIGSSEVGFGSSTAKIANDVSNLSIGQIVDVTISDGNNKATVPVMIRLRTLGMEPIALVELLSLVGTDNSLKTKLRQVRVGEKELFADLVFGQDQIDSYRRAVVSDKSGYFRKAHARVNKGLIATLLTGQPSVGDATSICIISKDTQHEVEDKMNGRFSDFSIRQQMFEGGLLLFLFVVDPDLETLTIYTRDIEDYGVYTIKDIRGAGPANSNNDLTDIMKTYLEGRVPGRL